METNERRAKRVNSLGAEWINMLRQGWREAFEGERYVVT